LNRLAAVAPGGGGSVTSLTRTSGLALSAATTRAPGEVMLPGIRAAVRAEARQPSASSSAPTAASSSSGVEKVLEERSRAASSVRRGVWRAAGALAVGGLAPENHIFFSLFLSLKEEVEGLMGAVEKEQRESV